MEATEPTLDERIEKRRAELRAKRAAIPDDGALPISTTIDERAAIQQRRIEADLDLQHFEAAVGTAVGGNDADLAWRDHLNTWREILCAELLGLPARIRDKATLAVQADLTFGIKLIDFGLDGAGPLPIVNLSSTRIGMLMSAAGFETDGDALRGPKGWRGSLPAVERRITAHAVAQAAADARLAAVLISDAERAAREADAKALRDAYNKMDVCIALDGRSLVAYKDGDVFAVVDMTEHQRRAFEQANEAYVAAQAARPGATTTS